MLIGGFMCVHRRYLTLAATHLILARAPATTAGDNRGAAMAEQQQQSGLPPPEALALRCAKLTSALSYMSQTQLRDFCNSEIGAEDLVTDADMVGATHEWRGAMRLPAGNFSFLSYAADDPGLGGKQARAIAMDVAARHPASTVITISPHVSSSACTPVPAPCSTRCVLHLRHTP
jgi:hypothetical protein